jgi:methyl-accepting chemotaxis protein
MEGVLSVDLPEEQSSVSDEIARDMEKINTFVNETVTMIDHARTGIGQLDKQANRLEETMRWFKL